MEIKRAPARFYRSPAGGEPVRDWRRSLPKAERIAIGQDLKRAEFQWPIGMPLCRPIRGVPGLWELRSVVPNGKAARIFFARGTAN